MLRDHARSVAGITAALLLPLGGLAAAPAGAATAAPAADAAAPADVAALRTGFERRNGADWTTLAEEQAFLAALDARSPRVEIDVIGRTTQGRPLQLVQMGAPAPTTQAQAQRGRTVLFLCSQHGDEPSGRESCLSSMRDLAATNDETLRAQLRSTTVLFVPTANPDGRAANTRENAAGVDINRDHLQLQTPEAQATAQVIRDWRPEVVHDLHEYGSQEDYDRQLIHLWPRNLNVDDTVHDLAQTLSQRFVGPAAVDAGYTTGIYGLLYAGDEPYAQIAGDEDERILRNMSGLRQSAGLLVEANQDPTTAAEEADPALLNRRRAETQTIAVQATLRFLRLRGGELQAATVAARQQAVAEGRAADRPIYWNGADNRVPTPEEVAARPPCGYLLTPQQAGGIRTQLDLHGIQRTRAGADVYVPMSQAAEPVIPLLLDARADYELVAARPLTCQAAAAAALA